MPIVWINWLIDDFYIQSEIITRIKKQQIFLLSKKEFIEYQKLKEQRKEIINLLKK